MSNSLPEFESEDLSHLGHHVASVVERVVATTKSMLQRQRTSLHRQVSVKTIPTR